MYEKKKGDAVTGIQVLLKKKAESFSSPQCLALGGKRIVLNAFPSKFYMK